MCKLSDFFNLMLTRLCGSIEIEANWTLHSTVSRYWINREIWEYYKKCTHGCSCPTCASRVCSCHRCRCRSREYPSSEDCHASQARRGGTVSRARKANSEACYGPDEALCVRTKCPMIGQKLAYNFKCILGLLDDLTSIESTRPIPQADCVACCWTDRGSSNWRELRCRMAGVSGSCHSSRARWDAQIATAVDWCCGRGLKFEWKLRRH